MGKKGDLSNFERGMVVGARRAGLSVSQSAQLLGFSRRTISRVYKEWCEKGKTSSMRQSCGPKCLVDARGQRRMGRLIQADRRATLTEITTRYNRENDGKAPEKHGQALLLICKPCACALELCVISPQRDLMDYGPNT
uniref:Tc3 transposase DNA binding domain-containing protein n=1 Tax=Cyprinus carpio carpio TaxID=630221 RepID=A0A9J7YBC7_CYPCA